MAGRDGADVHGPAHLHRHPAGDGTTDFEMVEAFSGLLLPMIKGSLPDFAPVFDRYALDLKKEAEGGES